MTFRTTGLSESMQSFVILCRSSAVYLAGAVGTGVSGGPASLGAGVPCSESSSSSRLLCPAKRDGFLQERGRHLSRHLSSLSKESPRHPSISISKILDRSKISSSSSPETSPEASPSSPTSKNGTHDPIWLGIVRTLEDLRDWI